MRKYWKLTIMGILASVCLWSQEMPTYLNTSLDFETRALNLVRQMTLDEKISQIGNAADSIPRLGIKEYDWWNECLHGVARAGEATVFSDNRHGGYF